MKTCVCITRGIGNNTEKLGNNTEKKIDDCMI